MANVNSVVVSGNLTRDAEARWLNPELTEAGVPKTAIVSFGLANNRSRFDKEAGEYVEEVSFIDVEVFGGFAILALKKLKKGDSTTVQGRLQQQTWEKDGEKKSKLVVVADQIDSEGFFRSKDQDNAVALPSADGTTAAATEAAPAAAAPADDDIPF